MMDFSDLAAQRHAQDLAEAAGQKPITKHELSQGYKRYENAGVKLGRAKKNMTDEQLYKMATEDVINWHKATKAEAERKRVEAEQRRVAEEAQRVEQERQFQQAQQAAQQAAERAAQQAAQQAAQAQRSSSGGGSLLPDTSMTPSGRTAPKLDNILDPRYRDQQLARNGFANAKPPSYALSSKQQFDAWIARAVRQRALKNASAVMTPTGFKVQQSPRGVVRQPIASNRTPVLR